MLERTAVERTIATHLNSVLGPSMIRSSIEVHCRSLKIDGPTLTADQLDALLHRIALGLHIFIGQEKTAQLMADIQSTLASTK